MTVKIGFQKDHHDPLSVFDVFLNKKHLLPNAIDYLRLYSNHGPSA